MPPMIYAGSEINPPPPPMASTNPASPTKGQTIRNVVQSKNSILYLPSYKIGIPNYT